MSDDEWRPATAAELAHRWRERTLPESVREAVVVAGASEEFATPDSALRWLLRLAWHDLQSARRSAANGRWSIDCEHQVGNIVGLTRLTEPVSWKDVPADLVVDGVYEEVHEVMGEPTPLSDEDRSLAQATIDYRYDRASQT